MRLPSGTPRHTPPHPATAHQATDKKNGKPPSGDLPYNACSFSYLGNIGHGIAGPGVVIREEVELIVVVILAHQVAGVLLVDGI